MSREGDGSGGNTSQSLSLLFFAPLPSAKLLARGGEEWARRGEVWLGAVPGGRRAGSVRGVSWGFCRQVTPSPRAGRDAGRSSLMLAAPLSPFGPGLLSASASTCPDHPPPGSREGARWVSPTSSRTVLRLACLQIHQIIHAKQPFRNHFLCFFEALLYSSICLI